MTRFRQYLSPSLFINFVSLTALLGSLAYLVIGLPAPVRFAVPVAALALSFVLARRFPKIDDNRPHQTPHSRSDKLVITIYCLLALAGIYFLLAGRSQRPLIMPWETVSPFLFLVYGAASALLYALHNKLTPWLLAIHYGWSFSVFLFVYAVGYGFDPFIHEASIKAIEEFGKIQPTTLYYLGQYSLVASLHTWFGGTVAWWSAVLVPALAAVSIPFALVKAGGKSNMLAVGLALLLFPFALFTVTTPQNLAYLWLVLAILRSMNVTGTRDEIVIWLLAAAALFTQPIAGVPALLVAASITSARLPIRWQTIWKYSSLAAYVVVLPLAFYFLTPGAHQLGLVWPDFGLLFSSLAPANPSTENWWLNFTYLFANNRVLLYVLLVAIGFIAAVRKRSCIHIWRFGLPMFALLISAIAAMSIDFSYLINYERADYPTRLLVVAGLFAMPFAITPLRDLLARIGAEPIKRRIAWIILVSALTAASLYLSYPRFDHYHNSRGYATSAVDLTAVQWVERDAGNEEYIVLANQQVSAAALRHGGFKKYYHDDLFYYPIPTGGPLYAYYLDMIETPNRETMRQAMELAGVERAYFVVNDYWWAADKIIDESRQIANHTEILADGQVAVFEFEK